MSSTSADTCTHTHTQREKRKRDGTCIGTSAGAGAGTCIADRTTIFDYISGAALHQFEKFAGTRLVCMCRCRRDFVQKGYLGRIRGRNKTDKEEGKEVPNLPQTSPGLVEWFDTRGQLNLNCP